MTGTENQAPASSQLSPLAESHKSSRDSSPQIESSPLRPVTNVRVQTPELQFKKRTHTPEFKVYNENATFNNQQSPTPSPVRSPLCEKNSSSSSSNSSSVLSSPTVVVPGAPEHGRRSPASTRPKSPPTLTAKSTKPMTDNKIHETLHEEDNQDPIAALAKQLQERTARLEKLKQQKKDKDQALRDARSKTASLQKQLKEMKRDITNAEATLRREETDVQAIRERVRHINDEIDDNQNIIQEFAQLTQEQDKEDVDKEKEIDELMNLIPERLVRIQELKLLLGEE
ncbi:hypothetical protein BDB00DRAFT_871767 [Zychaea mexicana]|uniref:uncharacterized protein n=1 Tax=Zychaea mexicana TaxID=64656 RepID=UPI0022FF440E|nr:uncharacterized protein BDB00DRAFT_871767 [Zychaea mexicana]KAI9494007.1 hypothetical protein BDB00DRAFT_871767 [Zychaea mexicana]